VLVRVQFLIDHKKIKKNSFIKKLYFSIKKGLASLSFF
jgi:hypothetical protein